MTVMVDQSAPLASLHSALRKTLAAMQQEAQSRPGRRCVACPSPAAPPPPSPTQTSPPRAGAGLAAPLLSSLQPRWRTSRGRRQAGAGVRWSASWCRWRRGTGRWRRPCRCSPPGGWCPGRGSAASRPVQIARFGAFKTCIVNQLPYCFFFKHLLRFNMLNGRLCIIALQRNCTIFV